MIGRIHAPVKCEHYCRKNDQQSEIALPPIVSIFYDKYKLVLIIIN